MHLNVLRLTVRFSVCLLVQNAAAQECRAKNSINFNINHFNKRLNGYVIQNITVPAAADCARECFSLTKCLSFNMASSISLCQLNSVNSSTTPIPYLVADNKFNYFDLSVIPETAAGPCGKKPCLMHQICLPSNDKHTCANVECSPYIAPTNGKVKPTTAIIADRNVTVSCRAGFSIVGASLLTCQFDGHWTGVAPKCKRDCPPAAAPSNGQISAPNSYEGENATYTCLDGYSFIGSKTATCVEGAWSPTAPLCKQDCPPAAAPSNGQISAPNSYEGVNATYTCLDGYSLIGSKTATCVEGAWSPSAPLCKQDCPPAAAPSNGQVSAPNSYEGETATYTCLDGYSLIGSKTATCAEGAWGPSTPICKQARDCYDVLNFGIGSNSGMYTVYLQNNKPHDVYCDMVTDGWTVFQRRQDGSVDFYRGWEDYVEGFGDPNGEVWMGLEPLYRILSNAPNDFELRVDLESFEGEKRYAEYSTFYIDGAAAKYRLHVGGYCGNAGDSLTYHNSRPFMTKEGNNCAVRFTGAWWYKTCHNSNLNGVYYPNGTATAPFGKHVVWYAWKGHTVSLKKTEMKIRRKL